MKPHSFWTKSDNMVSVNHNELIINDPWIAEIFFSINFIINKIMLIAKLLMGVCLFSVKLAKKNHRLLSGLYNPNLLL